MSPSHSHFRAAGGGARAPALLALLALAAARGAAAAEWTRKGCFQDGGQRLLGARGNDGNFDSCRASAEANGMNTFGLQYYGCVRATAVHDAKPHACAAG